MSGTYSKLLKQQPQTQKLHPITSPAPQPIDSTPQNRTEFRSVERSEIRPENRTANLPIKRKTKRYSFEFYDDQIFKLKQLKREAEDNNENLTLSDMAREALDLYLKSKNIS